MTLRRIRIYEHGIAGALIALGAILLASATPAIADTVTPVGNEGTLIQSQAWASTGTNQTPTTVQGNPNSTGGGVSISDLTGNGPVTSNYQFTQSYSNPNGSYVSGTGPLGNGNTYGFINSYVIDVPTSTSAAYLFSLNLTSQSGLDNLTARLYEYNASGIQNLNVGTTGPVTTGLIDSWSASSNGLVASTTLLPTNIVGGYYVLEVAGLETGTISGAYDGQLSITPVPVPAALPLAFAGFAGLAAFARRRRNPQTLDA
jgi:hypothetical protein